MKVLLSLLILCAGFTRAASAPAPPISDAETSRRLTSEAASLFEAEKKVGQRWSAIADGNDPDRKPGDGVANVFYADVLALLDSALAFDPANLHARTLAAQVLLLKSYEGSQTYDACLLAEAGSDADAVIRAASAPADDLVMARSIRKQINAIPQAEVPDPPDGCDDDSDTPAVTASAQIQA